MSELPQPTVLVLPDGTRDDRTSRAELSRGLYRRSYAISGPPGSFALQRVETHVRYMCGDVPVVEYRGTYWEFFRFAEDGSLGTLEGGVPQRDVHAFDHRRDGWNPARLTELYRQYLRDADGRPCRCRRPARILCTKTFLLGPGDVEDAEVIQETEDGGGFGFLPQGPAGGSDVSLVLRAPGGAPETPLPVRSPFPRADAERGTGQFTSDEGWGVTEEFAYVFATTSGSFEDSGGYLKRDLTL